MPDRRRLLIKLSAKLRVVGRERENAREKERQETRAFRERTEEKETS